MDPWSSGRIKRADRENCHEKCGFRVFFTGFPELFSVFVCLIAIYLQCLQIYYLNLFVFGACRDSFLKGENIRHF